jgi:hypothetical protein
MMKQKCDEGSFLCRLVLMVRKRAGEEAAGDRELAALAGELHAEARIAERRLREMPEHATRAEEAAAIEAILQPGEAIADRMLGLRAMTGGSAEARRRAMLWKRGEYIDVYLGGAAVG